MLGQSEQRQYRPCNMYYSGKYIDYESAEWTVWNNSDSATQEGSLRYCMTNAMAGDTIEIMPVLEDLAATGYTDRIIITATISRNVSLTINGNGIIISPPATASSFDIFSACNLTAYNITFGESVTTGTGNFFYNSTLTFNSCKFQNMPSKASGYLLRNSVVNCNYCIFTNLGTIGYYQICYYVGTIVSNFRFCSFYNLNGNGLFRGVVLITYCYFNISGSVFHGNVTTTNDCVLIGCHIQGSGYIGYGYGMTIINCTIVNKYVAFSGSYGSNCVLNFKSNTIYIADTSTTPIFNGVQTGTTGVVLNVRNNLIISNRKTLLGAITGECTVNESGNIYRTTDASAYFPNSLKFTGAIADILNPVLTELNPGIYDSVKYHEPLGVAIDYCPRLADVLTDQLEHDRDEMTDCGAVELNKVGI